ncbi:hypothetical protein [Butyrivibrio sp. VCD2006]|uniref:hypothetical protein n=1 Tax=Butyrivibrio sp. VCD2006 TaxID=1280664 RepID=UPI0004206801|nr:hypothetical protein [Butyrivibrio sp. VCD2006]
MRVRENKGFFQFINGVLSTYGFTVLVFIPIVILFGEGAKDFSSLFSLGGAALSMATLIQLFILAIIINICSTVLFTDRWIKNMAILVRSILFFAIVTLAIVVFVIRFHWFPVDYVEAWIGFFISFGVCSTLGVVVGRLKEKSENERMNQALEKYINGK